MQDDPAATGPGPTATEPAGSGDTAPADRGAESGEPAGNASGPATSTDQALDTLDGQPLAEHPGVYERIHDDLRAALADIDDA